MQQVVRNTMQHLLANRTCDKAEVVMDSTPHTGRAVAAQQRCKALLRDGWKAGVRPREDVFEQAHVH